MNEYDSDKMADVLARLRRPRRSPSVPRTPTSSCSTPARCARRRRSACSTTWAACARSRRERPISSSASAAASRRRKARRSSGARPYVDVVFGPQTLHRLPAADRARGARPAGRRSTSAFPEIEKFDHLPPPRVEGATAFVSIMEGCSKYCTFCVVPYTRGEEVSRPFDDVLTEIADLADQGVMEITLLGQNVNAYRGPMGGRRRDRRLRDAARIRRRDPRHRAHPLHDVAPEGDDAAPHRRATARSPSWSPTCTCRCSPAPTACSPR